MYQNAFQRLFAITLLTKATVKLFLEIAQSFTKQKKRSIIGLMICVENRNLIISHCLS
jgi:hypothetical protein